MNLLFDTHALITQFYGEGGCEIVEELMRSVESGESNGYISVVTIAELQYLLLRRYGEKEATIRLHPVMASDLTIIPVSISIALSAGSMKKTGISLADTMIAATALEIDATVVSGDPHFSDMGVPIQTYP
jgi:predicted nucleic acid-binding protein